ncbi:uncharacterized protein LOC119660032 [Hermetia illucens]|uniref:uncharacterized protein LOC119660032 n=1 Tax=Hermetia illucens TaxID=343691 RepID=UPI0018CC2A68|nr:uncharacterized protein LOC119660032 [Hermetia illucens]
MEGFVRYFFVFITCSSLSLARRECMRIDMLSVRHGQTGGYTTIFSTFLNDTFVDIRADVLRTVENPTWGIEVTRWGPAQRSTNFFNTSILLCEMERMSRRNLFLQVFREVVKDMTNFTLKCPLVAGR